MSVIEERKPSMSAIVDQFNQLHKRTVVNTNTDDEYELVDTPPLRYSHVIDDIIRITEAGELYNTRNLQLLNIDDNNSFKNVVSNSTTRIANNIEWISFYAHKENGDVFSGTIYNSYLGEYRLIRSNVKIIGYAIHRYGIIVVENDEIKCIRDSRNDVTIPNCHNGQVLDIRDGVIILTNSIIIQSNGQIASITLRLDYDQLLGVGSIIRSIGLYAPDPYGDIIIYRKDGKLVTLFRGERSAEYSEVNNRILIDMDHQ